MNSVQSRKRRQNIVSRMFGNVKHVNFYVTTVNSMLPMKLHPFPSLIKFLMTQLAKSGTIRGKDWSEKLASRNESLALFKADISSKVGCSYPVRLELGYLLNDDLIENVLRAWRALGGLAYKCVKTLDFFDHIATVSGALVKLFPRGSTSILALADAVIVALVDAIMANLLIQGDTHSYLYNAIYSREGLELLEQIREYNCLSLSGGPFRVVEVDGDAKIQVVDPSLFMELMESFSRDRYCKDTDLFAQIVRLMNAASEDDLRVVATELRVAYLFSLSMESNRKLEHLDSGYLSRKGVTLKKSDRAEAVAGIFDLSRLGSDQPRGRHFVLLQILTQFKSTEFAQRAIDAIGITLCAMLYYYAL